MTIALHGTPVADMWIAFLRDPDGIPVELVERPRSAFR
jgi:catechol 2,3-dioxygenase-like lactoylglutathione lyase family enzyme